MTSEAMFVLYLLGLILSVLIAVVTVTSYINKIAKVAGEDLNKAVALVRRDFDQELKTNEHHFGETVQAVREHTNLIAKKLYEVELYNRDNYIPRKDFFAIIKEFKEDMTDLRNSIKLDMEKLGDKISNIR
jgi:hypothetical protein